MKAYYGNLEKCQKINVRQTVLFLCTKWHVKCFCKKNTPFLARFYDSMQCFQLNKKHNLLLATSNLGLQLQFKCFRIFNNINQHNIPSRNVIKKHGNKSYVQPTRPKMWYRSTSSAWCGTWVCETFHNIPTLSLRRWHLCPQFTNRQGT
jgi:hypothetical protein